MATSFTFTLHRLINEYLTEYSVCRDSSMEW